MSGGNAMQGTFTGRHMLAIMLAFFAVIIGVNVTMATLAGTSWTGFVVRNTYVASQEFNGKVAAARAQQALGWQARLTSREGGVRLVLSDRDGQPIAMDRAVLLFRSPASDVQDRSLELLADGSSMRAQLDVRDGVWVVEIKAFVPGHEVWRDTRRILLVDGAIR